MEMISLKLDAVMLKNIDETLVENNYSTRTEFIRDAIRKNLEKYQRSKIAYEFMKFKGKAKNTTSRKENQKVAETVLKTIIDENGWDV